ncbi:MAG TPA: D-2-hydroxyacid dehydrogenase [Terriglobales bacterium]|nr:D-2-hydroxyacid dehydrogenase [Terriglobales bacterium]
MKLLILPYHRGSFWNAPPEFSERLRKEFPQLEVVHLSDDDQIEKEISDAEIAVTWTLRPNQFNAAKKLRWIHSPAAAVHQLLFPELIASDVILTNGREVHGATVAELVIGLIFALAKKLPLAMRCQQQRVWGQNQVWESRPQPREVAGATLGLIGLGSIGTEVAKRASALGMRVIAVRNRVAAGKPDNVEQVYPSSQIDLMLSKSDYVVVAAPLTSSTAGMINAERLASMKPDAYLINVSRGQLVDEFALAEALRSGKIAGAALDVFEQEPLPPDSPLWNLQNLLITPHIAGFSRNLWEKHYAFFTENLRRYLSHRPLVAVVDKSKGY